MKSSCVALAFCLVAAAPALAQEDIPSLGQLSFDKSFGRKGVIRSIEAGGEALKQPGLIEVDPQGRVVVAGVTLTGGSPRYGTDEYAIRVARFLPDGTLDPTFGGDGIATVALESRFLYGLAIDGLGGITLTGVFHGVGETFDDTRYVAARLRDDGSPDTGFSGDGLLEAPALLGSDPSVGWVRGSPVDGSVVMTSGIRGGERQHGTLIRVKGDGSVDESFGVAGVLDLGEFTGDFAIESDGSIVVALRAIYVDRNDDVRVIRFHADGTRDSDFGSLGVLRGLGASAVRPEQLELDGQGRIVVVGTEPGVGRAVYRFTPAGELDVSFSRIGRAPLPLGVPGNAHPWAIEFAVARNADRYALFSQLWFSRNEFAHPSRDGYCVQAIDPAAPRAIQSIVRSSPHGIAYPSVEVNGMAVSADGTAAFVIGFTKLDRTRAVPMLQRIDLTKSAPRPLPNLTVEWTGTPVFDPEPVGSVSGAVRVRNTGPAAVATAALAIYVSADDRLDSGDTLILSTTTGALRANGSKAKRFKIEGTVQLGGPRLIAVVNPLGTLPESDDADNVAVSEPILLE